MGDEGWDEEEMVVGGDSVAPPSAAGLAPPAPSTPPAHHHHSHGDGGEVREEAEAVAAHAASEAEKRAADKVYLDHVHDVLGPGIVYRILYAHYVKDFEEVITAMGEQLRLLEAEPAAPQYHAFTALVLIAKRKPELFAAAEIFSKLRVWLDKDYMNRTLHNHPVLPVAACRLINHALSPMPEWPVDLVNDYISDSLAQRVWVDMDPVQPFVARLLTVFPALPGAPHEDRRFSDSTCADVKDFLLETIRHYLQRWPAKVSNVLLLLRDAMGYDEVRTIAVTHMETWMGNLSIAKVVRLLLAQLVRCTVGTSQVDMSVLQKLLHMRVKSMALQMYVDTLAQLLPNHTEYAGMALKTFLTNELLPTRPPHNGKLISTVLAALGRDGPTELAFTLQELATLRDHAPMLRVLLRRVVKMVGAHNMDFVLLCKGLMHDRTEMHEQPADVREAWLKTLVNLLCTAMVLCASQAAHAGTDEARERFFVAIERIQMDCVAWCQTVLPHYANGIVSSFFVHTLKHLLFLDAPETYYGTGEHITDLERSSLHMLMVAVPMHEDTMTHVFLMHAAMKMFSADHVLHVIEVMLMRAARLEPYREGSLRVQNMQIVEALLNELPVYPIHLPAQVYSPSVPFGYETLFWKACECVAIICTFNPPIASAVWQSHPTLRFILRALATKRWTFPPEGEPQLLTQFEALKKNERTLVLEMEGMLARHHAESRGEIPIHVDADNSRLLHLLLTLPPAPQQVARRVPAEVLRHLIETDNTLNLGARLRATREPNFLAEIIRTQGSQAAMSWLSPLLQTEPHVVDLLPIESMCELLLVASVESARAEHVLTILAHHLWHRDGDEARTILTFFLNRLHTADGEESRARARTTMALLCAFHNVDAAAMQGGTEARTAAAAEAAAAVEAAASHRVWVMALEELPFFEDAKDTICSALARTLATDFDGDFVCAVLAFLRVHAPTGPVERATDVARMLSTRHYARDVLMAQPAVGKAVLDVLAEGARVLAGDGTGAFGGGLNSAETEAEAEVDVGGGRYRVRRVLLDGVVFALASAAPRQGGDAGGVAEALAADLLAVLPGAVPVAPATAVLGADSMRRAACTPHAELMQYAVAQLGVDDLWRVLARMGLDGTCVQCAVDALAERVDASKPLEGVTAAQAAHVLRQLDHYVAHANVTLPAGLADALSREASSSRVDVRGAATVHVQGLLRQRDDMEASATQPATVTRKGMEKLVDAAAADASAFSALYAALHTPAHVDHLVHVLSARTPAGKALFTHEGMALALIGVLARAHSSKEEKRVRKLLGVVTSDDAVPPRVVAFARACRHHPTRHVRVPDAAPPADSLRAWVADVLRESHVEAGTRQLLERLQGVGDNASMAGLLVDALTRIHGSSSEAASTLLMQACVDSEAWARGTRLLLSELLHSGAWPTITRCLRWLLAADDAMAARIDACHALDFVAACLRHPRATLGNMDYAVSEHVEPLFAFTPAHACRIADLLVREMADGSIEWTAAYFSRRMPLLVDVLRFGADKLHHVAAHLLVCNVAGTHAHEASAELLVRLYLAFPTRLQAMHSHVLAMHATPLQTTKLDSVVHRAVQLLSSEEHGAQAYTVLRQLATAHTELVLSALPLVAALVCDKGSVDGGAIHKKNVHTLLLQVLSLLDVLRPASLQHEATERIFAELFTMCRRLKRAFPFLHPLMGKFADLLLFYVRSGANVHKLAAHERALQRMREFFPALTKVEAVLKLVSNRTRAGETKALPPAEGAPIAPHEVHRVRQRLSVRANGTRVGDAERALGELSAASTVMPSALVPFADEIVALLGQPHARLRASAHELLLRLVHHSPSAAQRVMGRYMKLFDSADSSVVTDAVHHVPTYVALCPAYGASLVERLMALRGHTAVAQGKVADVLRNMVSVA